MCRCAKLIGALGGVALVTACTIPPPSGPTVMAIPPAGKNLRFFSRKTGSAEATRRLRSEPCRQDRRPPRPAPSAQRPRLRRARPPTRQLGTRARRLVAHQATRATSRLVRPMQLPARTMCRRATTSLTPSAFTHPAMLSCQCQPAFMAIMLLRARSIPGTAIPGSSGPDWASLEAASSYSTGTTNSIMASTVFMRDSTGDFTGVRTRAVCMAEVTGAADPRPSCDA